jgi:hypothetical protein
MKIEIPVCKVCGKQACQCLLSVPEDKRICPECRKVANGSRKQKK